MQYTTKALEKAIEAQRERRDKYHHRDFFIELSGQGLDLPLAEEVRAIIREKTSGGTK